MANYRFLLLLFLLLSGSWIEKAMGKSPEYFTGVHGVVIYTGYAPLAAKPIKVYYNIPAGGKRATMPILFVMSGVNRNAEDYLKAWVSASNAKGFMVFAPEFSSTYYPGSANYNQGGIYSGSTLRPEAEWTFSLIEPLFDFIVADLGGSQQRYDMWGHSAGGQFVHRYVLFKPEARLNRAVAGNPGWYTLPDFAVTYPYGLESSPATPASLEHAFAQTLVVQLGTADIDENDPNLEHNASVDAQGLTRYARGKYFWSVATAMSNKMGSPFNWQMREVAGVAHDYKKMAAAAAKFMY